MVPSKSERILLTSRSSQQMGKAEDLEKSVNKPETQPKASRIACRASTSHLMGFRKQAASSAYRLHGWKRGGEQWG